MTFEVIPAIDVGRGRLVRMSSGGVVPVDAFGGDPVQAASAFARGGATRLHFVDVDLADSGVPGNLDALGSVAALGVPVQASGGVTTGGQIQALLAAGADRVVLGSAALAAREATERLLGDLGDRLCVGIEADGPVIRPRGRAAGLSLRDTLEWLAGVEVRRFVYTEVGRVGALAGPDLDRIRAIAGRTERPVLVSGGIRSLEDLRSVARLGGNVEGAIVGRALHDGLDLPEALAAVRS